MSYLAAPAVDHGEMRILVRREAADVGALAMMIADVCGDLAQLTRVPPRAFVLLRPCGHRIPVDVTGNEVHGAIPAACPECGDPPRTGQIFVEGMTTGAEFKIVTKVVWP